MTNLTDLNKYYRTDNATAVAADVAVGKTAYVNGGKVIGEGVYSPAMMQFDGSTSSYSLLGTSISGNLQTMTLRFRVDPFTGGGSAYPFRCWDAGTGYDRMSFYILASDHSLPHRQNKLHLVSDDSSNVRSVQLITPDSVCDGEVHTVFAAIDSTNGTAIFIVDGVSAIDSGNADHIGPQVYTMHTGSQNVVVGAADTVPNSPANGDIGFAGLRAAYLTNYSDFMDSGGNPIKQDEATWANSGWGSQPLFWNEHGQMSNNQGSAGDMTENGIIVVGKGGNLV